MTSPQAYGDYQTEIYLNALQGVLPDLPMAYAELEERAQGDAAALGLVVRGRRRRGRAHPAGERQRPSVAGA